MDPFICNSWTVVSIIVSIQSITSNMNEYFLFSHNYFLLLVSKLKCICQSWKLILYTRTRNMQFDRNSIMNTQPGGITILINRSRNRLHYKYWNRFNDENMCFSSSSTRMCMSLVRVHSLHTHTHVYIWKSKQVDADSGNNKVKRSDMYLCKRKNT